MMDERMELLRSLAGEIRAEEGDSRLGLRLGELLLELRELDAFEFEAAAAQAS